jgi:hypothetical protein
MSMDSPSDMTQTGNATVRTVPAGRIVADSVLYGILFGAVPAAVGDKLLADVIFFIPISAVLAVIVGLVVAFIAKNRGLPLPFWRTVLFPGLVIAFIGFCVGVPWRQDVRYNWVQSAFAVYGLFLGFGAGLGAAGAANRSDERATPW